MQSCCWMTTRDHPQQVSRTHRSKRLLTIHLKSVYVSSRTAPACRWPPCSRCHRRRFHQQVIYCFNYRQKEYQKHFITPPNRFDPCRSPCGSKGVTITLHKMSWGWRGGGGGGPGNPEWTQLQRASSPRCLKRRREKCNTE